MRDLFGEVAVTIDDVECWLDVIVNNRVSTLKLGYYVVNWNVVDKIRAAKLDGDWERIERERADRLGDVRIDRGALLRRAYGFFSYVARD